MFGGFPLEFPLINYDAQPKEYRSAPIEKRRTASGGMQSQQNIGANRSGKYKSYDGAYQTSSDNGSIDIRSYADSLQEELIEKIQENDSLKREVTALKSSMQGLEQRSNNITREMALKMNSGECFENVNDEFSNSNIARKLETLYNDDWVKLFRLLGKERQNLQELERIKILSTLMKRSYDECKLIAERKLRQFLYLDEKELLCPEEVQEILKTGRKFWLKNSVREKVKRNVLEITFSMEEAKAFIEENKTNVNEAMKEFYSKFIDCCWFIAISHPPAVLNFEVVGNQYEEIKEYFTEFATKKPVQDLSKREQTIVLVVWPSVELKGESKYYKKGEVISVKIGKRFDESGDPHMNSMPFYTSFSISHGQDEPYEVFSFQNIDKSLPSTYV